VVSRFSAFLPALNGVSVTVMETLVIIGVTGVHAMTAVTFDTLQFVQRLKKAGIKENEAEAIAEAVRDVQANTKNELEQRITESNTNLATKYDIETVRKDIETVKKDLEVKIAETKAEIAHTKADLVKWVVSVGVLQSALIGALLLRLLPG
jgi:hydroxylamine reductase (hybrid-cluster protein)